MLTGTESVYLLLYSDPVGFSCIPPENTGHSRDCKDNLSEKNENSTKPKKKEP